jgi:hypothetical protein
VLEWDGIRWKPAAPATSSYTLPSNVAYRPTVGAGTPGIAGRVEGEMHYDTTAGQLLILIGTPSTLITSDFDPDENPLGSPFTLLGSGSIEALGGVAVQTGTTNGGAYVTIGATTHDVSVDVTAGSDTSINNRGIEVKATSFNNGYFFANTGGGSYNLFKAGSGLTGGVSGPSVATATRNLRMTATTGGVIKCYADNSLLISYTDGSPLTGTLAGFRLNDGSTTRSTFDNFAAADPGTAAWVAV